MTVIVEDHLIVGPPLPATFSFWATLAGAVLALNGRSRLAGAVLLLLVGYGGIGVAWERTCRCDLRQFQRPPRNAVTGVVTHLPMAVAGHALIKTSGQKLRSRSG